MSKAREALAGRLEARLGGKLVRVASNCGELTYELDKDDLVEVATLLRDDVDFGFEQLIDCATSSAGVSCCTASGVRGSSASPAASCRPA